MQTLNSSVSSSKKEKPSKAPKQVSITMQDVSRLVSSTSINTACAKIFESLAKQKKKKTLSSTKKSFKKKTVKNKKKNSLKGNIIDINLYRSLNYRKVKSVTFEPQTKPKLLLTLETLNKIILLTYTRELKCYHLENDSVELFTYMVLNDSPCAISHKTNFLFLLYDSIQCGYIEIRDDNTFAKRLIFFPQKANLPLGLSLTTKIDDFIFIFDSQRKFYQYDWLQSSEIKSFSFSSPVLFSQLSDTHIYLYLEDHRLLSKELLSAGSDFELHSDFKSLFEFEQGDVRFFHRLKTCSMVAFRNRVCIIADADRALTSFDLTLVGFCVSDQFIIFAERHQIVYVDASSWELTSDCVTSFKDITHIGALGPNLIVCHGQFELSHIPISN
jgi:hypothetical protein